MLTGTLDGAALVATAPQVDQPALDSLELGPATILTSMHEQVGSREDLFPPALHPTVPVVVRFQIWDAPHAAVGPVRIAMVLLTCRSGLRPRTLLAGAVVDADVEVHERLSSGWAFPTTAGTVQVDVGYHRSTACACIGDRCVLSLRLTDPSPLADDDVQFFSALHPAKTSAGERLVQVDATVLAHRAERSRPSLDVFDTAGWCTNGLAPGMSMTASVVRGDLGIGPVRFLNRTDVLAFDGTEKVG